MFRCAAKLELELQHCSIMVLYGSGVRSCSFSTVVQSCSSMCSYQRHSCSLVVQQFSRVQVCGHIRDTVVVVVFTCAVILEIQLQPCSTVVQSCSRVRSCQKYSCSVAVFRCAVMLEIQLQSSSLVVFMCVVLLEIQAPFTQRENVDISTRFGLSFTQKPILNLSQKIMISKNSGQSGDF